jgi:D-glycero-alpha-D-manno-heptose 1-phosphate guanylyltransferase
MEAIILAGGLGTRLAGRLAGVPKPMAPVAGRPFLEILLLQLRRAGCMRAILSVGYLHHVIQNHFGAAFEGMRIDYAIETAPLGTGGAVRAALSQTSEEAVLAMNGDTYRQMDYADLMRFHRAEGAAATIALVHVDDVSRYGSVRVEQKRVVAFEEKGQARSGVMPGWINAGAYVLNRNLEWPERLGERFSIETDFFAAEVERLRPAAYEMRGYFLDIGVPEDLDRAQRELAVDCGS